tara:strand:+ start:12515 stop:13228 length:714 start_codon:yes stop_codon:yes gene_type:complete
MKKAIIIGATSGMGKELCQILLANDYQLGIAAPEEDLLEVIKATDPHYIHTTCYDAIEEENTPHLNKLAETLGGLDLLVFCAGIGNFNGSDGHKKENQANELNVLAFTEIAYWAYHFFEQQGHGHLAAITSLAGLFGYRKAPAYHAAKAYQIHYLEALRQKAHRSGKPLYITDIRPGFVNTQMADEDEKFLTLSRERAAREIYKSIKRKNTVTYLSTRWALIALAVKLLPRALRTRM